MYAYEEVLGWVPAVVSQQAGEEVGSIILVGRHWVILFVSNESEE